MMLDTFDNDRLQQLQPDELSDSLERGSVVFFPQSPVTLPAAEDLEFFRQELPKRLKLKKNYEKPSEYRRRKKREALRRQRIADSKRNSRPRRY